MNLRTSLLLLTVAAGLTTDALAGSFSTCSNGNKHHVPWKLTSVWPVKFEPAVTLSASSVSFPAGSTWRAALQTAADRWNHSPALVLYYMSWNDSSVGENNGQSEVWWSNGFGAPAVCKNWINCSTGVIVESDVLFDNTVAYTTSTFKSALNAYSGSGRPFQTTALHELGHAQGLDHTSNEYSIMGEDWDHIHANGSTTFAYAGEDATSTSREFYGTRPNPPRDLGVVHWRRTGMSNGYSTHDRTRILSLGGVELANFTSGNEPIYFVTKGSSVQVEFTYENMGPSSVTTDIRFLLSTNDFISTWDTTLSQQAFGVSPDSVYTTRRTVQIPSWVNSGQTYWIGVLIDPDLEHSEVTETNNATYVGVRIL